jgi:hypothetical protein
MSRVPRKWYVQLVHKISSSPSDRKGPFIGPSYPITDKKAAMKWLKKCDLDLGFRGSTGRAEEDGSYTLFFGNRSIWHACLIQPCKEEEEER